MAGANGNSIEIGQSDQVIILRYFFYFFVFNEGVFL